MKRTIKNIINVFGHAIILILMICFIAGCAGLIGRETQGKDTAVLTRILSVDTEVGQEKVFVRIKGDELLTYTAVEQAFPLSLNLEIPGSTISDASFNEPPPNEIIESVSASESTTRGHFTRVIISLKKDVPYDVDTSDESLVVSFSRNAEVGGEDIGADKEPGGQMSGQETLATRISKVDASETDQGVRISIRSDGKIVDFESFTIEETLESPARIVFDLFRIATETEDEQVLPVDSKWVKSVRYQGYPDRVRLVIDTENQYLGDFSAEPEIDGMVISVGEPSFIAETEPIAHASVSDKDNSDTVSGKGDAVMGETLLESKEGLPEEPMAMGPPAEQAVIGAGVSEPPEAELSMPREPGTEVEVTATPNMIITSDTNTISAVSANPTSEGLIISVNASGPIKNYDSFTLKSNEQFPARIVFDLFDVETVFHDNEQSEMVQSPWADKVRHLGYPNRVRLVVETRDEYLSAFSASPVEKGLEILIGPAMAQGVQEREGEISRESYTDTSIAEGLEKQVAPEPPEQEPEKMVEPVAEKPDMPPSLGGPKWVNRIDFKANENGRSAIVVGTNQPVRYKVEEAGDKKILLRLSDTRIPPERKRPLITTRFESAVDRIIPIQRPSMKDGLLSIELREMVPYEVKQAGNVLQVNFDASSVPPKPFEAAQLPSWKEVMKGAPVDEVSPAEPTPDSKVIAAPGVQAAQADEIMAGLEPDKKYSGEKIALDFYETDIKNVFRILREVSGKNFAIDTDVEGKVTLTLERPVPWDQVLDLILKMNQLGKIEEGDIIRIAKIATITKEERDRQAQIAAEAQAREQEKAVEPLFTEYIPINYSDAKTEILPHLENISTKERGTLSVDSRTNTIIMTDTAEKIQQAKQIVRRLDKVTPQVIIEARIVEASNSFSKEIGVSWGAEGGIQNDDPNAGIGPQRGFDALGGTYGYDAMVNLPVASAGTVGFQFSRIMGTPLLLDARLGAMETLGEGKIVSAPKVLTLDNKKATIKQGREIPYSVIDEEGRTNVLFKEVDLLLEVTPHVTPDNRIALRVFITKNEVAETLPNGVPAIATKEAETELLVNDGETIVIGGILQTNETSGVSAVPGLYKVPLLRWLFRSTSSSTRKEELLIFLTPRIVLLEQKNL